MAEFSGSSFVPSDIGRVDSGERVSPSEGIPQIEPNQLERTPPVHHLYFGRNPGGSFRLTSRKCQSTSSCFPIGHIKALTLRQSQKIFPEYH
ncbi:hypothetical protein TNCV_3259351 [Trichonephila clavipes]|nr:hypothetical protein TNCV_3259351 [Trichonephila clavipes]